MGYVTKDIAIITEPKILSLSGAPNFVTFASKAAAKVYLEFNVTININATDTNIQGKTTIRITEPSGIVHAFHGSTVASEVGGSVFYVSTDRSDTAENLREALLANRWINANFDIRIVSEFINNVPQNGRVLNIKSKATGTDYNITIIAPANAGNVAYTITPVNGASVNADSISGEASTAEIEIDVYTGSDTLLGADDRPLTPAKLGNLELVMQKTYAGVPVWFELNAIFSQYQPYNAPPAAVGWFDTGTVRVFRITARKKALNSFSFYQSNALFVLSGHASPNTAIDLTAYVYKSTPIKLLTNKPRTPYIKGQTEYLNFLFNDTSDNFELQVVYRAYSTADVFLGELYRHSKSRADFKTVNTCVLNIDAILTAYPNAGIVRVALARGTALVSNYLEYMVRPQALHELCQFTFLNALGGWDTFNFDSSIRYEPKAETETYTKTLTPAFKKGDSLETVYTSTLVDPRTVEGAPVTDEIANWLKELAASRVILDGEGNYIIKEDFSLPIAKGTANMQTPILKYRLSHD